VFNVSESLEQSYPADAESVRVARDAVCAFAARTGAHEGETDAIRLAVSEALTNAVVHAYRGDWGLIHLTAAVAADELHVVVADDGHGLRAGGGSPGQGLGFALIALSTDSFTIAKRSSGGIEVRLTFKLGSETLNGGRYDRGSFASAGHPV
jgi:anti-sigma regulatory factor (Ser/Thr protein kinase)